MQEKTKTYNYDDFKIFGKEEEAKPPISPNQADKDLRNKSFKWSKEISILKNI